MRSMMSIASACTRRSRDLKSSSARGRQSLRRPSSTASASAEGETIPGRVLAGGSEPRRGHRRVVDRQPTGCPAHVRGRASRCAPSTPTLAAFWATVHTKRRPPDPTSTASEVWSSRLLLGRRRRRNRSRVRGLAHGSWPSARKPEVNCGCYALAAYADLHASLGNLEEARCYLERALEHQSSPAQQALLRRKRSALER